jgi:N-methylhydantoinase A/oxoprolinase/acetone carboxylase beta subunit
VLAAEYPEIIKTLKDELQRQPAPEDGRFAMRQRQPFDGGEFTERVRYVWERLKNGPLSMAQLVEGVESPASVAYTTEELIDEGLISASGFTPTDAANVMGYYRVWSAEAAHLGADSWAHRLGMSVEELCHAVARRVVVQAGHIILETALAEEGAVMSADGENISRLFIDRALGTAPDGNVKVAVTLKLPVIGVGAPAHTYLLPLARTLRAPFFIPRYAEVGNAVGAVVGGVAQTVHVLIRQPAGVDGPFRVYSMAGNCDFLDFDRAVEHGKKTAHRLARDLARKAGADHVRVSVRHDDEVVDNASDSVFLGVEIIATAVGRPRLGHGLITSKTGKDKPAPRMVNI